MTDLKTTTNSKTVLVTLTFIVSLLSMYLVYKTVITKDAREMIKVVNGKYNNLAALDKVPFVVNILNNLHNLAVTV